LCHYIDPPWAQPLSNQELQSEPVDDVEKLKEKIQHLEAQLQGRQPMLEDHDYDHSDSSEVDLQDEPLNLGKKFDMLHIKSTTTTHLGATSWLAIMKGDPYLRVLWAHIFKVRKEVEEFKYRRRLQKHQLAQVNDTGTVAPATMQQPMLVMPRGQCPIARARPLKDLAVCPFAKNNAPASEPQTCPVSGQEQGQGKCPVAHDMEKDEILTSSMIKREYSEEDNETVDDTDSPKTDNSRSDERVCPLMIGDNSLLGMNNEDKTNQHQNKRRKTSRSNSNDSNKSGPRKVLPEDFKRDPVEMMQKYLPKKKLLWMFIERYFNVLYVYLPYIDEKMFREEVKMIMGSPDDEDQDIKIQIRYGADFALVGTVCIILRLVWNTLPINSSNKLLGKSISTKTYPEDPETLEIMQMKENEIPLELVDCVKHCFSNLKLMRKSSLKIVQCALYLRFYFMYSPEDGDGADGADSQIFLGMIIQMSISIGLHRDPKNFENFGDERQRHLWRKIWYALISLDVSQSMNLGCPRGLQHHEEFSDTMLPDEESLVEFSKDLRELTVVKNVRMQAKLDKLLSKTMKVLLDVNKPARRSHMDSLIDELHQSISGFGVIKDKDALPQLGKILVNRSKNEPLYTSGTRAIQFRAHVTVNMLVYLLNYILYVHFEPRGARDSQSGRIAKTYAQRALNCALEGYRNCSLFFDCGLEYFGPGADLILSPLLLLVGHRSMQFMVSLILRSRCGPFMKPAIIGDDKNVAQMKPTSSALSSGIEISHRNHDLDDIEIKDETEEYRSVFDVDVNSGETLATILLSHMDKFHDVAQKLGDKYPYSWRMSKAVGFFIILLRKPTNVVKSLVKTENLGDVENDTGEVSSLLNSVPLVLNVDEEQFKKCPIYSKAEVSATRSTVERNEKPEPEARVPTKLVPILCKPSTPQIIDTAQPASSSPMDPLTASNGILSLNMFSDPSGMDMAIPEQFSEAIMQPGLMTFNEADKSIGDMIDMMLNNGSSNAMKMGDTMMPFDGAGNGTGIDFGSIMNSGWFS
jgi:heme activator protein 1